MLKTIKGFKHTEEARLYQQAIQQRVDGAAQFIAAPSPQKPAPKAPVL